MHISMIVHLLLNSLLWVMTLGNILAWFRAEKCAVSIPDFLQKGGGGVCTGTVAYTDIMGYSLHEDSLGNWR